MKVVRTLAREGWIVLLTLAAATQAQERKPTGKGLDPEIVAAYEKLGATYGGMAPDEWGGFDFVAGAEIAQQNLPAFRFERTWKGKLPALNGPFGLAFHGFGTTDTELKQLADFKHLQMLHIGERVYIGEAGRPTKVTDAGVKSLAGLKELRSLELSYTQITDSGLKELAELKKLEFLELFDTQITDAGMKELAGFKKLRTLNLGYTKVTNAGLKELAGLERLQVLGLSNTKVTGAGLKEIAKLQQLRVLDFHFLMVTDAQLQELAGLKHLRKVYLEYCTVTDAGVRQLQKSLPSVTVYYK